MFVYAMLGAMLGGKVARCHPVVLVLVAVLRRTRMLSVVLAGLIFVRCLLVVGRVILRRGR